MQIQSMIYVSTGNLPSEIAHSVQIAKMAQAFSKEINKFELLTSGDIISFIKGMDHNFQEWYGLNSAFKLVRLPIKLKLEYPLANNYYLPKGFLKLAIFYTLLKFPDLVYTRTAAFVEIMLKIGYPVIWEFHEPIDSSSPYKSFLTDKSLIGIVTTLPQIAETYLKQGLPSEKLFIAPNAADLSNFEPYQNKSVARQKISIPLNTKLVVYSGHLYDYKGIPTILETAKMVSDCQFLLVGGWKEDIKKIKQICEQTNLNNVSIIGHVKHSELASYLYAADILILPTSQYWNLANATCPLKLFDYMAVKRPIVASALPTIMTILSDQQNAILAEPDNGLSFEKALKTLFQNPSLGEKIAERAFLDVQKMTWANRAKNILNFASERLEFLEYKRSHRLNYLFKYLKLTLSK